MDDNKKKFASNIIKHLRAFEEAEGNTAGESETSSDPAANTEAADDAAQSYGKASASDNAQEASGANAQGKFQLRLKNNAEKKNTDSFFSRLAATLAERAVLGGIIIYIIFMANIFGMIFYIKNSSLGLTQSLLYMLHFDTIAFKSFTFLEISILVSYFTAFLAGGLILFILLRIGAAIAELCKLIYSHKFTRLILFVFMAVLSAGALIIILSGNGMLSIAAYKWAAPLFSLAGGLLMYCMSLRKVDIS